MVLRSNWNHLAGRRGRNRPRKSSKDLTVPTSGRINAALKSNWFALFFLVRQLESSLFTGLVNSKFRGIKPSSSSAFRLGKTLLGSELAYSVVRVPR